MHLLYCRKIFATYLRLEGVEQEIIDLLQGRIPRNVFVRHYFRPNFAKQNESPYPWKIFMKKLNDFG
jgi:intergrase/recombinase